jgi:hypothetical protein
MSEKQEKRGRGRPRKHPVQKKNTGPKMGRGRPRKHDIAESHVYVDAEGVKRVLSKPEIKKVDQLYLFEKVMQYLLKVQVVHNALYQANTSTKPIYQRLRELDLQMIEICQSVFGLDKAA